MNLYQAGYTRRGRQGEGAGWSIVFPSEDMSHAARDGFSGFAGNLAELVNGSVMPKEAFGVFRHDRFLYYLNINYEVSGGETADARGVSFTHGYCFNLADYYTLCQEPERLLGVKEGTFLKEYDPSVKALPVAHELAYDPMDYGKLMEKYGLSQEDYRHLLIGATCALEGFTDALCVKADVGLEEYGQVCREIMYLIMRGLPCHLRTKLTFFSYAGGKTNVYFSRKTEGSNYFDLDTKEHAYDKSKLERYKFTQLYGIPEDGLRQRLLQAMAKFVDEAFDIHLKDIDCNQVEHAFQAQLKNVLGKAVDKDLTISLLTSFLGYPLKESDAVEEYLAVLLESISENNLTVKDSKLLSRVVNRAQNSANQALHNSYLVFYARQILALEEREGHELLWEQYKENKEQYDILINAISRMDADYYRQFFEKTFLPSRLKNLDSILSYLEESGGQVGSQELFWELLDKATEREMRAAQGFRGQRKVRSKAEKAASLMDQGAEDYLLYVDYLLWHHFDMAQFDPNDIGEYEKCSLRKLAKEGFEKNKVREARNVCNLIGIADGTAIDQESLYDVFFTEKIFKDRSVRKIAQGLLKKNLLKKGYLESAFDVDASILSFYHLNEGRMDVTKWIRKLFRMGYESMFSSQKLPDAVDQSYLLGNPRLRGSVIRSLEAELEEKTWRAGEEDDRQIKRAMELTLACLNNEELPGDGEADAGQNFRFCLHKLVVGHLAAVSIAAFAWCLWKYADMGILALALVIAAAVGAVAVVAVRIYLEGDISEYLGNLGIEEPRDLIIAVACEGGMILLSAALWLVARKLPALQGAAGSGPKTILAIAGCAVVTLVAIGGIVMAMFLGDEENA